MAGLHEGCGRCGEEGGSDESHPGVLEEVRLRTLCLDGHQGHKRKQTRWNLAGGYMGARCKMDSILLLT